MPEAELSKQGHGLAPEADGWFVVKVADAAAFRHERSGTLVRFEGLDDLFGDLGINVRVLQPGQSNGLYHSESVQEDFLVLAGECVLIVDDQERRLRAWDFAHFPPGTPHIAVGAGDRPCAILMVGARRPNATLHYPVSEVAARHGASVSQATDSPPEAYSSAGWEPRYEPVKLPWPPPGRRHDAPDYRGPP